jgi:hypothetical protein
MRDDPPPLVTREQVEAYVTPLLATSNALINLAVKLARCEDNVATAKAAALLWAISIVGRCFSTMTLVGLSMLYIRQLSSPFAQYHSLIVCYCCFNSICHCIHNSKVIFTQQRTK